MVWNHSPDIDATLPGAVSEGFAADVISPLNSRTQDICSGLFQVPLLNAVPYPIEVLSWQFAVFNPVSYRPR